MQAMARPALSGWLGHEAPFAFDLDYRPGPGIERMRVGTPPILQLAALDAALDVWDDGRSWPTCAPPLWRLQDRFHRRVEAACPALVLATPRAHGDARQPGVVPPSEGYAIMQALIAEGVIGDFRAPDILRFGFTPLYIDAADVDRAAAILIRILDEGRWDRPEFKARARVT
jgi:kynureninase